MKIKTIDSEWTNVNIHKDLRVDLDSSFQIFSLRKS